MIQYLYIGGGAIALAFVVGLVWFAYCSGRNAASINTAHTATDNANGITEKAEAMAQAQADAPATKEGVLARLEQGAA